MVGDMTWRRSNVPVPEAYLLGIAAEAWRQRSQHRVLPGPGNVYRLVGWSLVAAGMYLGWALLHLGTGLATRSVWMLGTLSVTAAWVHREIRAEERRLGEKFRAEFRRYCRDVPRYLPAPSHWAARL